MKIITKENSKRLLSLVLSLVMAFSLCMPAFAAEQTAELFGTVEAFTKGITVSGKEEILATNTEEITLYFSKADPSIYRLEDGWWAGIKVVAPADLSVEELKDVKYRRFGSEGWSDPISFWGAKDSKDGDAVHYMEAWMIVTPELIAREADEEQGGDGKLTINYEFDWYGNGFEGDVQKIDFVLDATKINLDFDRFLGSVEALTSGITVSGKEEILATNTEEITIYFSKADPSIYRLEDGWWAGIKVVAPADLSAEELKDVKYRRFGSEGWSDPISFWSAKDSKDGDAVHYMEAWMLVTPELIAREADEKQGGDGKLTINYEFDWYGNGFEGDVQKIDFVLDATKINLDFDRFLGSVEALTSGITVSGKEEILATNEDEITLYFSKADPSIYRLEDGWWAGIKVVAPADLSAEELKDVKYRRFGSEGWSDPISFWSAKDSKDGDAVHYMEAWMLVTPELIAREADEEQGGDGKLTINYEFDWYGNGFEGDVQKIDFVLDATKINLDFDRFLGSVEALTSGITVSGKEEILATNTEEITLYFSKADPSIYRLEDGWWAGIKVVAPADLSAEELKDVKYRRFGSEGWSDPISFWSAKDSKDGDAVHYMEAWMLVTPELIAREADEEQGGDGKLTINYEFDWYGNGFEGDVQKIDFVLDATKINLVHREGCTTVVDEQAVAPDCTNPGKTEKSHCGVCGLVIGDGAPIEALGHDFTEKIIDEAHLAKTKTCTTYAQYYYDCSRCDVKSGETFENVEEGFEPHDKSEAVDSKYLASEADCENAAKYYVSCENCGTAFEDEMFEYGTPNYHLFMLEKVTVKAGLDKDGATNFYCVDCGKIDNAPIPFAGIKTVTLSAAAFDFSGKAITPAVTVKDRDGVALKSGTDYTVSYSNNKAPGTASVKVTFIGKYTGSKTLSFTIRQLPATSKLSASATTNTVTLSWNKVNNATGYKVYDANGKQVADVTGTSVTVKNLSSAAKHTFTVKAYAAVDGKTYISTASKSISTATKPLAVSSLTASTTTSEVTLKWSKVAGADNYIVYKYNEKTKVYDAYKTVTGTSLTIKSLNSATTYTFKVAPVKLDANNTKAEGASKTVKATTKPAAVSSFTSSATASAVTLKWSKVTGADSYNIYMYNSKTKKYDLYKNVTGTSLTIKSLKSATTFAFKVAAVKLDSNKAKLEGASKTVKATTKPAAVSKLTASATTSAVTLKWSKVTGADSYNVYKYNSKTKKYDLYKNVTGTSLTIKSLKSATTFAFKVAAVKLDSNKAKVTGASKTVKATTKPGAVSKLNASVTTTSVTLKWSKVSGADSYNVYKYNAKTKKYDLYKNVKGTSLTIKGLKNATTYAYAVRAVKLDSNKAKVTGSAKTVSVTTKPLAISKLTATSTASSVTLKWGKVKGADDYRVYKYNTKTKKYELYKKVTGTSITIKNLNDETSYSYRVRTAKVTADGEVTLGDAKKITVKTKVGAPVKPEKISVSVKSGKATVKWSKVKGADGYQVAYKDGKTGKNVLMGEMKTNATTLTKGGFTKGVKYVFGVRSYKVIDGKRVYSSFTTKTVTMK